MSAGATQRLLDLLGIDLPIIQAPMAGYDTPAMATGVAKAGGLGSLACALLTPDQVREAWSAVRAQTDKAINLNFFCHVQQADSSAQQERWKARLTPYFREFGIDADNVPPSATRAPFDTHFCAVVEEIKPQVVSFHFGLPAPDFLQRVKNTGAVILSSATTVGEARWLEERGCDAIIAQGVEAGGHRGIFLSDDLSTQTSTENLVRDIAAQVSIPVIAAGGIAEETDVQKAFVWGASAVQVGTAYLFCPEAKVSPLYRDTLASNRETTLTNVFSGRPARGIINRFISEVGPLSPDAPAFPYASKYVAPLRSESEKADSADFMQIWSGTKRRPHTMNAEVLTRALCAYL